MKKYNKRNNLIVHDRKHTYETEDMLTHEDILKTMPKIGDTVTEEINIKNRSENNWTKEENPVREGVVTYVNERGHYYTVEFDIHGTKVRESYKLPEPDPEVFHDSVADDLIDQCYGYRSNEAKNILED